MTKILAEVQVRMSSSRLPGKVLKEILGKPMLWHLVNRLKHAQLVNKIIIATSDNESDKPIIKFAEENGIAYYAGSELDLVDRLFQAAKRFGADAIVRITGDCPLVDPALVDKVTKTYLDNKDSLDYVSNINPRTYPDGLDTEIFSFQALKNVWNEIKEPFQREWITTNFYEHPEKYRLANVQNNENLSYMRWTVDYKDDLDFVTEIYKRLYDEQRIFLMDEILNLLKKKPELMEVNKHHETNEGYVKALEQAGKISRPEQIACKGIIFDFDGTLVNLDVGWESVREKLSTLAKQFGVDFNTSSVLGSICEAHNSLTQDPERIKLANRFLYTAKEIIVQAELAGLDKATLVPGAREILEWLAESKISVAVLSNNDSSCVRMALAKFNLPTPMVIIGRDAVSFPKPETEGALLALDILGLEPSECWLVGDSPPDLEVGRAVGLMTILLYSSSTEYKQNQQHGIGPEVSTITDLFQLRSMLEK